MQKLVFDPSWDRALSEQDRQEIMTLFEDTQASDKMFPILWTAVNYRGELLITVMIHNFSDHQIDFSNTELQYTENGELMARHRFQLPNVKLDAYESMVWTFIFPESSRKSKEAPAHGELSIA